MPGKPWLVWSDTVFDYGLKIIDGEPIEGEFTFRNEGEDVLRLTRVKPGCGCTAVDYDREVPPGGTGQIQFLIDPEAVLTDGDSRKNILVWSNSPGHILSELHTIGEVRLPIEVKPTPDVFFGRVDQGRPATQKLVIVSHAIEPLEILDVAADSPRFKASAKLVRPGKQYELTVTAIPPYLPGTNEGRIHLTTNLKHQPRVTVVARARYLTRIRPRPEELMIRLWEPESRTYRIQVINDQQPPAKLLGAKVSSPELTARIVKNPISGRQEVEVEVPAKLESLNPNTYVSVALNDMEFGLLKVPVITHQEWLLRKAGNALGEHLPSGRSDGHDDLPPTPLLPKTP